MSNIIKSLRNLRGYTQEEVAKELGIALKSYNMRENNPDKFTVLEIKKMSKLFEVDESIFFKDKVTLTVTR
jgi:putative transcriptional regulator